MSTNWSHDIYMMHEHYGMNDAVDKLPVDSLKKFLEFRINFLQEEIDELRDSSPDGPEPSAEGVVDALIDLCVVAIGTLDAFSVDGEVAWDAVLEANLAKRVGVNPSRPNELGLPDLIKPEGWQAPSHDGNHGTLSRLYEEQPVYEDDRAETESKPAYGPCEI